MTTFTTTVTRRSQTTVPADIRKRYNIQPGDTLTWIDNGEAIKVIPLPQDPIAALRGCAEGEALTEKLLNTRQEDRQRKQNRER
jgi:AbrB family looped-hinge helix DNA binding protein